MLVHGNDPEIESSSPAIAGYLSRHRREGLKANKMLMAVGFPTGQVKYS